MQNYRGKILSLILVPKVLQNVCEIVDTFELLFNTELVQIIFFRDKHIEQLLWEPAKKKSRPQKVCC
jgi:hypothetical protein